MDVFVAELAIFLQRILCGVNSHIRARKTYSPQLMGECLKFIDNFLKDGMKISKLTEPSFESFAEEARNMAKHVLPSLARGSADFWQKGLSALLGNSPEPNLEVIWRSVWEHYADAEAEWKPMSTPAVYILRIYNIVVGVNQL